MKFQWEAPSVTSRPYSQVITERSAANVALFKYTYENNCQKLKFLRREENVLEFVLENEYFPDTDGVVFDAATVEGEEAEEIEELEDKGNESMKNDKNYVFLNYVNIYSLSLQ